MAVPIDPSPTDERQRRSVQRIGIGAVVSLATVALMLLPASASA